MIGSMVIILPIGHDADIDLICSAVIVCRMFVLS